jgi:hypothetical protein
MDHNRNRSLTNEGPKHSELYKTTLDFGDAALGGQMV